MDISSKRKTAPMYCVDYLHMPNQRPEQTKEESEQSQYMINNIKLTIPEDKSRKQNHFFKDNKI